ncbi:hypothetical protein [Microbacterium sp. p3-SID336]|uniref:hypothetical protein n=1 Tax=Microbacterium sp. p3-SID336 TaxID=2916212 RepID=UPI0021A4995F|nr:hypothetical protein [Microbacterium sp. p3-SID336]MCT1476891.1 hypothetical protein [Microbacterium sp. p3-SID336]
MDTAITTELLDLGPIDTNWTIEQLLDHLTDDSAVGDPALAPALRQVEAAVTAVDWTRTPSVVALIRSLALAVAADPELRPRTLADLLRTASPATRPAAAATPHTATRARGVEAGLLTLALGPGERSDRARPPDRAAARVPQSA